MATSSWTGSQIRAYYQRRVPKLKISPKVKEWRGPCPIHNGERNSLAVSAETGEAYCHSKCGRGWSMVQLEAMLSGTDQATAYKEIAALVGKSSTNGSRSHTANGSGRKIVKTHQYTDEEGRELFETVRYEPKDFQQRHKVDGRYVWNIKDVRRVLYRLPKVIAAERVVIVEGEKDVETLEAHGFTATTCPMGARKWRDEYSDFLAGKTVVIIPDNDPEGLKHAEMVKRSVSSKARSVRVVTISPGKDITEWFESGGSKEKFDELIDAAGEKADAPPSRFRLTEDGVFFVDPDPNRVPLWICAPLRLIAETRGRNSLGWGVLVEWKDRGGDIHRWAIPHGSLKGDCGEVLSTLRDGGLHISTRSRERNLLIEYLNQPCGRLLYSALKVGWSGVSFVFPDETLGPRNAEEVVFQADLEGHQNFKTSGSVEDWKKNVGRLCVGNSRLQFAVSCAFAGPLLTLCNFDNGGFHFVGETSCGKSTALIVGGSVIGGGGRNGFVQSWHTTANGLEAIAEQHNDLTLFLDELAQVDPKQASEVAYLLGNGSGKGRMSKTISARRKLSWSLLFVSAGEITLREHAGSVGKRTKGGVEVRLLNIRADAEKGLGSFEEIHGAESPAQFSNMLRTSAKRTFGAPFRAYMRHVVDNQAELEERCRREVRRFSEAHAPKNSSNEVGRAAARFGVVAAAGELASQIGVTGWNPGDAERAALRCFQSWILERGSVRSSDEDEAVRSVRQFLQRFGASRFSDMRGQSTVIHDRAGFRKPEDPPEPEAFLILGEVFRTEICAGANYKLVASALSQRGHLKKRPDKWTVKVRIPAMGGALVDVFWIRNTIFEEEED